MVPAGKRIKVGDAHKMEDDVTLCLSPFSMEYVAYQIARQINITSIANEGISFVIWIYL